MSSSIFFPEKTRYFSISNRKGAFAFFILVSIIIIGLSNLPKNNTDLTGKGEDLVCYKNIADRIRSGEGYYQAARAELVSWGYHTGSVFNWRPPLLALALGHIPAIVARAIAVLLSLFAVCVWISILGQELDFGKVFAGSLLFLGPPIYSFTADIYVAHEFWAGTLIICSILFYVKGWRYPAFAVGILALFIRELALPFVFMMLLLSLYERKYKESAIWASGIIAFSAMMVIHYFYVKEVMPPDKIYNYGQWITLGGWKFVISTASVHPYLLLLPSWVTAVLLPLMLLGLSGWKGPLGLRMGLTVGMYIFIFLFVGQTFNLYWGSLYANLLFPGFLYLPAVIIDLSRSIQGIKTEAP